MLLNKKKKSKKEQCSLSENLSSFFKKKNDWFKLLIGILVKWNLSTSYVDKDGSQSFS